MCIHNPAFTALSLSSCIGSKMEAKADASDAAALVESLARASNSLSREDVRDLHRVCEAGKVTQETSARQLVSRAAGSPMMTSKSSDGTPITVVVRTEHELPSGQKVVRSGRTCEEYLVKNQFFRAVLSSGECVTRALLQDPLPLTHGKAAPQIFQACLKDWKSLRQLGHQGCAIEHYAFDRCGIKALERAWRQWHALEAPGFDGLSPPNVPVDVFRLTEFVVVTACAAHDANNAFKWALASRFENKDLLRDAYICVESLRNSWTTISRHVCEWIALRLSYADDWSVEQIDQRRTVWTSLSVDCETAEVLAETLHLRFADGRLMVARSLQGQGDVVSTICAALLSTWRFRRWTESRFFSVGVSSRALVAGLLTGLEDLVQFIMDKGTASLFYLNGFKRLRGDVKTMMTECAIVSRVTEGAMVSLLEDPRVCVTYTELWQSVSEEMLWVSQLPLPVWDVLASVSETTPAALRSNCIAAAHCSKHFFWRRVLQPAGQRPWSLSRGDLRQNLEQLRSEGGDEHDPFTLQMWLLLKAGFPVQQLVRTLELLRDVAWTTLTVEQQHGSLASLRRLHPEYGSDTLTARATVLQMRRLLPKPSDEERELMRLSKGIRKLLAKQPSKAAGRQALLAALFEVFRARSWHDRAKPKGIEQRMLTNHHNIWMRSTLEQQRGWERIALLRSSQKHAAIASDLDGLRAARDLLLSRMREEGEGEHKPLLMSGSPFSQEDLELFGRLLVSDDFAGSSLERKRQETQRVPVATPPAMLRQMEAQNIYLDLEVSMPGWVASIANNREYFVDSALVCYDEEDNVSYYKVLYAIQNPYYLALTELRRLEEFVTLRPVNASSWGTMALATPRYAFHCNYAAHRSAADIPRNDNLAIFVLTDLQHTGQCRVVTHDFPTPLEEYLAKLPNKAKAKRSADATPAATKRTVSDDTYDLPWLAELDLKQGFEARKPSPAQDASSGTSAGHKDDQLLEDEVIDEVMKQLAVARQALAEESEVSHDDFGTRVVGGTSAMKSKGTAYDSIQGFARTELAKDFCIRRDIQKSISFDYTIYGGECCSIMARAWCHRMQWLFDKDLACVIQRETAFKPSDMKDYVEPSEFTRFAADATGKAAARVNQIRRFPWP